MCQIHHTFKKCTKAYRRRRFTEHEI
jgi:hypothetical protein